MERDRELDEKRMIKVEDKEIKKEREEGDWEIEQEGRRMKKEMEFLGVKEDRKGKERQGKGYIRKPKGDGEYENK